MSLAKVSSAGKPPGDTDSGFGRKGFNAADILAQSPCGTGEASARNSTVPAARPEKRFVPHTPMVIVQHFGPRDLAVLTDRYANNDRLAVFAVENGEPYTDLSVNMPEEALADGEFIFKTYTENEGLFDQFVASGAVEFTGRYTESRVALPICRLTIQADR